MLECIKSEIKSLTFFASENHGKKEWGSPVTPSILEAYILHQADNTSAKTNENVCLPIISSYALHSIIDVPI